MIHRYVKKGGWLLFVLIFSQNLFSQSYEIEVSDEPLEQVLQRLEGSYGWHFSYKVADIEEVIITATIRSTTLRSFFEELLASTSLGFELLNDTYIIIKADPGQRAVTGKEEVSAKILRATVIDSFTRKPLPYAGVFIQGTRTGGLATEEGVFTLATSYKPDDMLVIRYVGYEELVIPVKACEGPDYPVFLLSNKHVQEDYVVITDYMTDGIQLGDNGTSTILRPNQIGALPGQAEPDVLRTIQFLPGITSPDGGASTIHIRGGTPDQNLILWEEIPIYHAAHYFGMISAFNPYIIDKVKVFRGGFGTEYGGRISGVIDMKSDDHRIKKSQFGAGLNFVNAYTHGKVSLWNNRASVVYSIRRSITQLWDSPTLNSLTQRNLQGILSSNWLIRDLPPGVRVSNEVDFFDTHVKASAQISEADELSVAWFYGNNNFSSLIMDDKKMERQDDQIKLNNQGASLSWKRNWGTSFSSKIVALGTRYKYDYTYDIRSIPPNVPDRFGVKQNNIDEFQVRVLGTFHLPYFHRLNLGYEFVNYDVDYRITQESDDAPRANESRQLVSHLNVFFAEFNSNKEKKFGADIGLRVSHYQRTQELYPEPRLRFWYNATDDLSIYTGAGKYYQFLSHLIEFKGDHADINSPIWVLAGNEKVPVLGSEQYQLGFVFNRKSLVVDLQTYVRRTEGLTSLAIGFDFQPEAGYHIGTSSTIGFDLLVKKRWKRFKSWISYSLSKTDYHFPTFFDEQFPSPYDQTHVFNWVNMLTVGNFELSLGWKYASGLPYSIARDFTIVRQPPPSMREQAIPVYDNYNDGRLPANHQLDASILYNILPKNSKRWHGVVGLSFYNIYDQQNVTSREFFVDMRPSANQRIEYVNKMDLGFTPNMVVRFEF